MKTHLMQYLLPTLFLLAGVPSLLADITSPMFASSTITIEGSTYEWDSANSSEDDTFRYDAYSLNGSSSVVLTGIIGSPDLAVVSGNGIDGHVWFGSYTKNHQSGSPVEGTFYAYNTTYTARQDDLTYQPDLVSGTVPWVGTISYSKEGETYQEWSDTDGNSGWSAWGSSQSSSPNSGLSQLSFFGASYVFSSGQSSWSDSSSSTSSSSWTDTFSSADGGVLYVSSSSDGTNENCYVWGWDPYGGSFNGGSLGAFSGLPEITFEPRTAPVFTQMQLWVDGTLVSWQSGQIDGSGTVTDAYSDSNGSTALVISGSIRPFDLDGANVAVSLDGSSIGSLTKAGGFEVIGHTILLSDPGTIHSTPCFSSSSCLYVNGSAYPFSQGFSDSDGNRTDTYVSPVFGTVTISGTMSDPDNGTVVAGYQTQADTGVYAAGDFTMGVLEILSELPPPVLLGPPAFSVWGDLFVREENANTFASTQAPGAVMTLSSSDNGATVDVLCENYWLPFTGTFSSGHAGVLIFHRVEGSEPLVAMPANEDGTLRLSGISPPVGLPPAVAIPDGRVWVFLGSWTEDSVSQAYYGEAAGVVGYSALLKIRPDTGQVTFIHSNGELASGTYSTSSHLFQTADAFTNFPVPIYGAEPTQSNTRWGLAAAPVGYPASFLIGTDVWHYVTTDDGFIIYQGCYTGQTLAVGPPDTANNGLRTVAVTDPVHGNTQGTLNDLRGSVKLRDGRIAYSGDFLGNRVKPTFNEANLHTIQADLDITGNFLSFGSLQGDSAIAGVTMQFMDQGGIASLHTALARPNAQWTWGRATDAGSLTTIQNMRLESNGRLTLSSGLTGAIPIVFYPEPSQFSIFSSKLKVLEDTVLEKNLAVGGGLTLGGTLNGPVTLQGNLNVKDGLVKVNGETLLTLKAANENYMAANSSDPVEFANGATVNGSIFSATQGATISGGLLTVTDGAAISGSIILSDTTIQGDVEIYGGASVDGPFTAGSTTTSTLVVNGGLTAHQTALFKAGVELDSGFMIRGRLEGGAVVAQPGQEILIPESGDISMGAYRAGPTPQTVSDP